MDRERLNPRRFTTLAHDSDVDFDVVCIAFALTISRSSVGRDFPCNRLRFRERCLLEVQTPRLVIVERQSTSTHDDNCPHHFYHTDMKASVVSIPACEQTVNEGKGSSETKQRD